MTDDILRPDRPRVSAAVLRDTGHEILMVKHQRSDGSAYWQLPGGGIEPGETLEVGVLRELWEETSLNGHVVRQLFTLPYTYGTSTTFLVEVDADATPVLGHDPEEVTAAHRKLVEVAWQQVDQMRDNVEIRAMLAVINSQHEEPS